MARIRAEVRHENGIPLGGIGTGSVEIRPDGYFHDWQIFNLGRWAPNQPEACKAAEPDLGPGGLSFFVRTARRGEAPRVRRLGVRTDQHDLYSLAWLRSVQAIDFTGAYPAARLAYRDADLPVDVEALMFSPFVPHDSRTSGTPGFHAVFAVRNRTDRPATVSVLSTLKNPLAWGAPDRKLQNRIRLAPAAAFLSLGTAADTPCRTTLGSLCLSVTGGTPSWILGEFAAYFPGYHTWYTGQDSFGRFHESLWDDFRETGALPSLPGDRSPQDLLAFTDARIRALSRAETRDLVRALRRYPFADAVWRRVRRIAPESLRTDAGLASFLQQIRLRLDRLTGADRRRQVWGDCALSSQIVLAPGESREIRFTFSWHFPHHYSANGPDLGHMYENWFPDAEGVNRFLADRFAAHRKTVVAFAETLFDTNLPPELPDAWAGQLTTIPKATWWTRNGDFGVWEGLGCCGFHTTDITYQGSFNLLALFPDLQKRQMEMGARFQRADGRVHHFFTPDFSTVDNGFDRVDMNPQFVLLVCRDYLWTGDRAYLKRLWPGIVKAMQATAELDGNGDGLPDRDTRRNTYDGWDFTGTPAYIASLWLSALLAGARLAADLGHRRQAAEWTRRLRRGVRSFDRLLWNGEYYSLWVDGKERDECCMTDQIDGEWFTQLIGLGPALPRARIVAALRAILRHNFREEGLVNASYPAGRKPRLCTHRNFQAVAPWTGIEYAVASMMMDFGMADEGLAVVRNIHERYLRAGRFWNHVECGDHYYRAMSSWAVLLGATGFKIDAARGVLSLAPLFADSCRAPWVASTGWGVFEAGTDGFRIECRAGTLSFRQLRVGARAQGTRVTLNGRRVPTPARRRAGRIEVAFPRGLRLTAGDTVAVG